MSHTDRNYRPDIDGLRALAVVVVMVFHAFPRGCRAVSSASTCSSSSPAILISGIILGAKPAGASLSRASTPAASAGSFRRSPLVLAAVLVGGWFLLYADDYASVGYHAAAGAAFASNIAFWREASYFDVAAELKPLLHLWSLGVEEQFYFVWPVLLILAARWRRGPLVATLAIGTLSFLIAIWTVRIDRTPAFYAPWNRFWELLAGATLACIDADAPLVARLRGLMALGRLADILSVIGLAAIAAGVLLIDQTRVFPGLWVLLPVTGTALLIAVGPRAVINRSILSLPLVVWVGLISYPLYLWHWPLLSFAHILVGDIPSWSMRLALLAASVVLAWITYRVIERPIRFGTRARFAVPALGLVLAAACAAGIAIYSPEGVIDRPVNRKTRRSSSTTTSGFEGRDSPRRTVINATSWLPTHARRRLIRRARRPARTHRVPLGRFLRAGAIARHSREPARECGTGAGDNLRLQRRD